MGGESVLLGRPVPAIGVDPGQALEGGRAPAVVLVDLAGHVGFGALGVGQRPPGRVQRLDGGGELDGGRLALRRPQAIPAIVTQNGNGYDEGFVESFWETVWDYQREQTPGTEAAIRTALGVEVIKWQYLTGVPDETLVSPDTWTHDAALLVRPGNDEVQLKLFRDYATNAPMYPALHHYLRSSQVPVLVVWGQGDPIFGPDGARAFGKDAPDAEIHLLTGGHFLLETAGHEVAELIRAFLQRVATA